MNRSQMTIFAITFLAVSLIANIFLFTGNSSKAAEIDKLAQQAAQQSDEIQSLNAQLEENKRQAKESESTINSVGNQQRELQSIAKEMQNQLKQLTTAYNKSLVTAEQTKEQLAAAENQRLQLQSRLDKQNEELEEAQKTISNQQRLLRAKASSGNSFSELENQQVLATLSNQLKDAYPNVLFRQTQTGAAVIEIPLDDLFESGTTKLKSDSELLLKPISNALSELTEPEIEIIGHSDSRPIVSELGLIYPTNWELSSARASKVAQRLSESGVDEQQMTVLGKSSSEPIREEANAEAWKLNRRLEIQFN